MNMTDPLDDTLTYNASGLIDMMKYKAGSIWGAYSVICMLILDMN